MAVGLTPDDYISAGVKALQSVDRALLLRANEVIIRSDLVVTAGNGGSSAVASHLTQGLMKPLPDGRYGILSVCVTDNVPLFSAFANDLGWMAGMTGAGSPWFEAFKRWKKGAVLVADHPFPVETRFLDGLTRHGVAMPYPLIDVASVRLAAGFDPIGTEPRLRNEEPAHNPLADARQSARLLLEALAACRAKAAT